MEILLTRHGQTEWNLLKKVQGKADIELNETGIQQAETTRDSLKEERIDLIVCAPLKRAIQTAEIINQGRNIRMIIDERDFGEFEGMSNTNFDFNAFWSYKQNLKYDKALVFALSSASSEVVHCNKFCFETIILYKVFIIASNDIYAL